MKIALVSIDSRQNERTYSETMPRFGAGVDSMIEGVKAMPDVQLHLISCTQQPMQSPEKLAENIWFDSLHVPKMGWLRTFYQGCIRATRQKFREIQPDIVHGVGTEREGAITAVFSGFPNVIAMAGNMVEQAKLHQPRFGSYYWVASRLEKFLLPRADGVISNSRYMEALVRPRAKRSWVIYPGLRTYFLQPPTFTGPRERALMIVGVVSPRKRQLELLDAAEALHRQGVKFEFRFAGKVGDDSTYARSFLRRIKPMEAAGYARYLGMPSHQELVEQFDRAAGMVHFPTEEAFGSVVAEGLARNLTFFGARTGGIVEICEGVPGAQLFQIDDWNGLTDAIGRWMQAGCADAPGAAEIMRARYSPEIYVRQHLAVYQTVVGAGAKGG